jgi:hypothetical protein
VEDLQWRRKKRAGGGPILELPDTTGNSITKRKEKKTGLIIDGVGLGKKQKSIEMNTTLSEAEATGQPRLVP